MLAHRFTHSHKSMNSSLEEDEEEFFETLEDIAASSDSESAEKEGHHRNASDNYINSVSCNYMDSVSNALSRYEVWKNSPRSILERRQRLFTRMGLTLEGVSFENSMVLVDVEPTVISSNPTSGNYNDVADVNQGYRNVSQRDRGASIKESVRAPSASAGCTIGRSRSDATFSSRLDSGVNMESTCIHLARSGNASPVSHEIGQKRLRGTSGSMLQTLSDCNHLSKPPLGRKRGTGISTTTTLEGLPAQRLQFQWSKFGRFTVTDENGNSLFDSSCSPGKAAVKESSGPLQNICRSGKSVGGGILCRIKDLDSGKEFVVNEVGKDGMWNKLKELETGREISVEEFELSLGLCPIVQEVMRREREASDLNAADTQVDAGKGPQKRKKSWLNALKGVLRSSRDEEGKLFQHGSGIDDTEGLVEKSGRRSGSATNDSQHKLVLSRPVKVRTHKKSAKEFADLRLRQEIQAHEGAIWTMKFSLDGSYLATAGQDRLVRVWEVLVPHNRPHESPFSLGELTAGSGKPNQDGLLLRNGDVRRCKNMPGMRTATSQIPMLFTLSENAKCVFKGHSKDVLDLSWSSSQSLLSSSMDKTVRLWDVSSRVCLRIFAHNDYVTCIQFHPFDAGHFLSGSLDGKVRIWNVQEPQVVDWVDLQEMVTAASYMPNGQGAVVGSYKGTCRFYKTSGNKLQLDTSFEVRNNRAKRSQGKKITGFQFVPGDKKKLLITSNDSRIRIYDGAEICSRFKGFRNTKSHISASVNTNGRFIICASEDSRVCIWNYDDSKYGYSKHQKRSSGSYEDFPAKHVLVAIPWPGMGMQPACLKPQDTKMVNLPSSLQREFDIPKASSVCGGISLPRSPSSNYYKAESVVLTEDFAHERTESDDMSSAVPLENASPGVSDVSRGMPTLSDLYNDAEVSEDASPLSPAGWLDTYRENCCRSFIHSNCIPGGSNGFLVDSKGSATWPEEKLVSLKRNSSRKASNNCSNAGAALVKEAATGEQVPTMTASALSAWGLVIVTAGLGGEIKIFQNFSLPIRL